MFCVGRWDVRQGAHDSVCSNGAAWRTTKDVCACYGMRCDALCEPNFQRTVDHTAVLTEGRIITYENHHKTNCKVRYNVCHPTQLEIRDEGWQNVLCDTPYDTHCADPCKIRIMVCDGMRAEINAAIDL
jgi:hypothetical protein